MGSGAPCTAGSGRSETLPTLRAEKEAGPWGLESQGGGRGGWTGSEGRTVSNAASTWDQVTHTGCQAGVRTYGWGQRYPLVLAAIEN